VDLIFRTAILTTEYRHIIACSNQYLVVAPARLLPVVFIQLRNNVFWGSPAKKFIVPSKPRRDNLECGNFLQFLSSVVIVYQRGGRQIYKKKS